MNKPRSPLGKRIVLNCKVDPATLEAIRTQAIPGKVSQSEVVDRAMAALSLVDDLLYFMQDIDTDHEAVAINLFERLNQWKEQSQ